MVVFTFSVMLYYGVKERKSGFVMAYMVLQMIGIVVLTIGLALLFFGSILLSTQDRRSLDEVGLCHPS